MVQSVIDFSVRNKLVIGVATIALIAWGIYSLKNVAVNTIPDISGNQVRVITVSQDLATQEVERFITYPVELEMANLPGVKDIRSVSKFGLSVVTVVFKDKMDLYLTRQLVKEKLSAVKEKIPAGLGEPKMAPIMSGLGEIYQYVLDTKPGYDSVYSAMDLRSIQDWLVRRQLSGIEGVVEINSWGGFVKQYEVAVKPDRLKSFDITIGDIFKALEKNNGNTGGSYIQRHDNAYFIRGEGLVESLDDIRNIRITTMNGTPVKVGDVARVRFGHATRLGAMTYNGKGETVGGQIMMLKGENSVDVIANVRNRIEQVRATLPEGVEIEPFINRSNLIKRTSGTVVENLALGGLIVILVLVLLLGNIRSGLIVASVIPLSMLFAIGLMYTFGIRANLMSMGAIDFGIIIDGAVIIVEYVLYQVYVKRKELRTLQGDPLREALDDLTSRASGRMMRTAFFGQVIILIVFVPVLSLTGVEGKMFRPMALTFGFALIGAMLLCLTFVPMMAALLLRPAKVEKETFSDKLIRKLQDVYQPVVSWVLRFKGWVLGGAVALLAVALWIFSGMGSVFMPKLDEGSFAIHPILKPGTSLRQTTETTTQLEKILLKEFPDEVEQVATRIGAGEVPADPMSLEMSDMIVQLSPEDQWTKADTKEELADKMREAMGVVPGVSFKFSQPIEMLFSHFLTGVNADVAIKIFGEDLNKLKEKGEQSKQILQSVRGISSITVEKVTGLPQIVVNYNRDKMAEYGIDIATVNHALSTGFSGKKAGTVYEGEKRFDMVVRLAEGSRENIEDIRNLYVETGEGGQVPLKTFADINYKTGPAQISRDNTHRRLVVSVNTGKRDVASVVEDIQKELKDNLDLPPGYRIQYEGDFQNLQKAERRLTLVVPAALFLILLLLYVTFNSMKQSLLVFTSIPLAGIGGVLLLWLRDMPFSISAAIGFIALSGIAVLNGIVMISFFNELKAEGYQNVHHRILRGTRQRLRPVMLTALTDMLGFLPMAVSQSAGAEVQRPLATVVVGGLITSSLLTLLVLPVIYSLSEGGGKNEGEGKIPAKAVSITLILCILPVLAGLPSFQTQAQDNKALKEAFKDPGNQGQATDSLTSREAVKIAMERHPGIKAGRIETRRRKALQKTVPDLGKTRLFYNEMEMNRESHLGVQGVGFKQTLDLPMKYSAQKDVYKKQTRLSRASLDQKRKMLTRKVRKAYQQVVYGQSKANLYAYLDSIYRRFEKAARLRLKSGEINRLEKTAAVAGAQEIKVKLRRARSELSRYSRSLKELMRVSDSLNVAGHELEPLSYRVVQDTQELRQHPAMQEQYRQMSVARAEQKNVQANWWPDLVLQYQEQWIRNQSGYYAFQAGIKVPLAFWTYKADAEAARLNAARQQAGYRERSRKMTTKYQNTLERYRQNREDLRYFRDERLTLANELLDNARQQFRAGSISYVEFAQYVNQAVEIKTEYLEVVRKYNRSVIDLKYYEE